MGQHVNVMISSTVRDLEEHRTYVMQACLSLGMFPVMMDFLPASHSDAIDKSLEMVDQADVYLGVFANRYGYVPESPKNPTRISVTEMELNRAIERGIPCLLFVMDREHPIVKADMEEDTNDPIELDRRKGLLNNLKNRIQTQWVINFFKSPEDLAARVTSSLHHIRENLIGAPASEVPLEQLAFPDYYDFEYIAHEVAARFSSQAGFLVVQYGSSVKQALNPNDEDFMILVHGNFYNGSPMREDVGHEKKLTGIWRPIDLQYRLFDSFLIALIMGKPYEISVALDGIVRDTHQMREEYWKWLQALVRHTTIDTEYLIGQLTRDLSEIRRDYAKVRAGGSIYSFIVIAYNYVCTMIQLQTLRRFPPIVPAVNAYPLSKAWDLYTQLRTPEAQNLFGALIGYFKRLDVPEDREKFDLQIQTLIDLLNEEMKDERQEETTH